MIYILNLDKTLIYPFDADKVTFVRKGSEITAESHYTNVTLAKYENDNKAEKAMADLVTAISKGNTSFVFEKYEEESSMEEIIERAEEMLEKDK